MIGSNISQYPIAGGVTIDTTQQQQSDILFNGLNFLDCVDGVYVDQTNRDDINQIELNTYNAPQTDGGGFLSMFVRGKTINMRIVIVQDTLEDLNDKIGELRRRLSIKNSTLAYKVNDEYREAVVNLENLTFNRDYTNDTVQGNIQATFRAMNFFKATIADSYYEHLENNTSYFDLYNEGETECYYQLHLIFGPTTSGVDTISLKKDGYTLTINQICNPGDVLIIDGVEKEILHNNAQTVDYTGPFVPLNIDSNPITLEINGTVDVDATFIYNKNYQ